MIRVFDWDPLFSITKEIRTLSSLLYLTLTFCAIVLKLASDAVILIPAPEASTVFNSIASSLVTFKVENSNSIVFPVSPGSVAKGR